MHRNAWGDYGNIEKLVEKAYGLRVDSHETYKKIMKITTTEGIKALKIINTSYAAYLFTCEAMEHAIRNGFRNISRVVPAKDGKVGLRTKYGIVTMNDWIDARQAEYKDINDLELTVKNLADLHKSSRRFKPSKASKPKMFYGKWIGHFKERRKEMQILKEIAKSKRQKSEFDKMVIGYIDFFNDRAKKSISSLERAGYEKVSEKDKRNNTFCHHDLGKQNVLITKNNQLYFIDFDNCIMDMNIHDVAGLILKNVRYKSDGIDKANLILNSYHKEKPFSDNEIEVMKALMKFPQDFYQVIVRYYKYAAKYQWSEKEFTEKLKLIIADIENMEKLFKHFG